MKIGLIGAGRAGGALALALRAAGYRIAGVADRDPGRARRLAERLGSSVCTGGEAASRAELVFLAVPDEAILEAQRETGRRAGLFGEPAAAAALAGLKQAVTEGVVGRRSSALAVLTGSGLKDVRAALRAGGSPVDLPPEDEALDEHLRERPLGWGR